MTRWPVCNAGPKRKPRPRPVKRWTVGYHYGFRPVELKCANRVVLALGDGRGRGMKLNYANAETLADLLNRLGAKLPGRERK